MSRKPDFKLTVFDQTNQQRGEIGAVWLDEGPRGSMTLRVNPGCAVTYNQDLIYKLWPVDASNERPIPPPYRPESPVRPFNAKPSTGFDDMDDDIPF